MLVKYNININTYAGDREELNIESHDTAFDDRS